MTAVQEIAPTTTRFLETADNIAIRICRDAIWHKDACNWVTMSHIPETGAEYFRALYNEFYVGTAGIAYFLSALYQVSPDPLYKKTALGALRQAYKLKDKTVEGNRMGFYRGWTGIAYTLIYAGHHLKAPRQVKEGLKLVDEICDLDYKDLKLDIVEGIAGAIPVLIKIQRKYPNKKLHQRILDLGDYLIEIAEKEEQGWSWRTLTHGQVNLTGFAHGVAGFVYTFLELYQYSKEAKYLEAAQQGIAYEKAHFNEAAQNWPDYRTNGRVEPMPADHVYPCVNAWCHGAPGIGLTRVRAFEVVGEAELRDEAYVAIKTTLQNTFLGNGHNCSLCHGTFGNADLLINASQTFQDDQLWETAQQFGVQGIEAYAAPNLPWPNGVGNHFQISDFMLGLSGMGYYYLRLIDPKQFPSMLLISSEGEM